MNKLKSIVLLFTIINILILLVSAIEENIAILVVGEVSLMFGVAIISFIFHKQYQNRSIVTFFLFYTIYFIVMYMGHHLILLHGLNFFSPDEKYFFDASNDVIPYLKSGYSLFDVSKIFIYHENSAQVFISGQLAILANYFGNNTIIIQKLSVVFFAALIPTTIYNIFVIFIKDKIALKSSIYYGLFSFIAFFSFRLLRDIAVAELFVLVIYLSIQRISFKNTVSLIILIILSITMRYETGIYSIGYVLIILLMYLYATKLNMTLKWMIISIPIILIVFSASTFLDIFNYMEEFSKQNLERVGEAASSNSIGMKLRTLPYGFNYVATTVFSQISPLPPWLHIDFDGFFILYLLEFIATISWFYVWFFVVIPLAFYKQWGILDFRIKFLFLYSLLYIILISSIEPETRRMLAVYPMIYLVAVINYISLNANKKKILLISSTLFYLMLLVSYQILKI